MESLITGRSEERAIFSVEEMQNANSILALMHGKTDSICRVYNKEIFIDMDKLGNLNELVHEKISLHNVPACTLSITITLTNKKIFEFTTWDQFRNFKWNYTNIHTKSVYLQWDFFLQLDGFAVPQKHSLSVRISSQPNSSEILKAMFTGGLDEIDSVDVNTSTLICKVDFINNVLAEELIHVVERWYENCEPAIKVKGRFIQFAYKFRRLLAHIFEWTVGILLILLLAVFMKLFLLTDNSTNYLTDIGHFVILSFLCFMPLYQIYSYLTNRCGALIFNKLEDIMDIHVFKITNGDEKHSQKIYKRSKITREMIMIISGICFDIILGIVFYLL